MRSRDTQEMAAALLGGKIIPKPKPITIVGQMISHMPTCRLKRDEYQQPIVTRLKPRPMNLCVSMPDLAKLPTSIIEVIQPMPRGACTSPAFQSVYPSNSSNTAG